MPLITEEQVELQSIEWFKELGYQYKDGYEIAPEGINPERDDFRQVILEDRLRSALIKINSDIPSQTIKTQKITKKSNSLEIKKRGLQRK